jgi:hypothetical protein
LKFVWIKCKTPVPKINTCLAMYCYWIERSHLCEHFCYDIRSSGCLWPDVLPDRTYLWTCIIT